MPGMKPPKGYYTMTQAKNKLDISDAMVRNYAKKGRIHYLVPEGSEQGFYKKQDVDKLAIELNVFLEMETEPSNFAIATATEIPACIDLNRDLFTGTLNSTDNTILYEKWGNWMRKTPEIVYVLKRDEEIIGIAITLPVKPHSVKLEEALRSDISMLQGNINIEMEDIEDYQAGNHIQLYIAGIGIKPGIGKDSRRKYGARLISSFTNYIINLGKRGVIIENIIAVGATRSGIRLLKHFGFSEEIFPRSDTRLFTLDMKESGAPIAHEYREGLKEHAKR